MNKTGIVVFFFIFCLMYIFNTFTPLLNDDYFMSFIWSVGAGINELSGNAKKIESFFDIFESLKGYYLTWGGRIPGQAMIMFFSWKGKEYFNIANAFMSIILIAEIYWLSHEGKITLDFDIPYIFWIFFSLWTFNIAFTESFLWLSGSCDYLWLLVILLAFLLPYVQNYYYSTLLEQDNFSVNLGMFLMGLLAGCSRETLVCWIILILSYWLYYCKARGNFQYWKIAGYFGLCIGYGILMLAPGNIARLAILGNISSNIFTNNSLLTYKFTELFVVFFFHLFLWYFILSFLFRHKKSETSKKHLSFIKLCTLIAFFSGGAMFFVPSRGVRISFVSLIFLLIAVCTIFRVQSQEGISSSYRKAQLLMKIIGYIYLVLTVSISLYGNYTNWRYWNSVITQLNTKKSATEIVTIKVIPPLTEQNKLWFYCSGFSHLTGLPIYDNGPMNYLIARYYGVKGIKVEKVR